MWPGNEAEGCSAHISSLGLPRVRLETLRPLCPDFSTHALVAPPIPLEDFAMSHWELRLTAGELVLQTCSAAGFLIPAQRGAQILKPGLFSHLQTISSQICLGFQQQGRGYRWARLLGSSRGCGKTLGSVPRHFSLVPLVSWEPEPGVSGCSVPLAANPLGNCLMISGLFPHLLR